MKSDNSSARVIQYLTGLAAGGEAGARLPSVRVLMRDLGVSPVTVQRALDRLTADGVVETRPGLGTFIARRRGAAPRSDFAWQSVALGPMRSRAEGLSGLSHMPAQGARPLNIGYLPDDLLPLSLLEAATARARSRPGIWSRMPIEGSDALRGWFASETGGAFQPGEVIICPGSQPAIASVFRALAGAGDPVLMESPTYPGAIAASRGAGLALVPVPTDAEGVRPDLLEEAFRRSGARLFYCQPRYANPTGAILSAARREAVLSIVARAGAFLVEDDWAGAFCLDGPAPPTLASLDRDGHVVLLRSLSKCAAPGLRVGAVFAHGAAFERLRVARVTEDFFVPGLMQETALQLVSASGWPRHANALRASLRTQRDRLAGVLRARLGEAALPALPAGGLYLWVRLPQGIDDEAVAREAARRDVLVSAGRHWFPAEPPGGFLRLSFAAIRPEWTEEAVAILAAVIGEAGASVAA